MKTRLLITTILMTLFISACATATPPATPEPVPATETSLPPTETQIPSTETSAPATDTPAAATEPPVATGDVSFTNDVLPILLTSCGQCHGVREVKEGLDLTTHAGIMAGSFNGAVITPGNANDSYLVQQIIDGEMPKRGPKLTAEQIQIITDWVNQGALNN
jgi:mono/diheme cytochrome c family protein